MVATALFGCVGVAQAAPIDFLFDYVGPGITASGDFTTDGDLVGGAYTVVGITGSRNGVTISGLVAPGGPNFGNDNKLSPTNPFVDGSGISFLAGGTEFNLATSASSSFQCQGTIEGGGASNPNCGPFNPVRLTVTQLTPVSVPEPGSAALIGLGMLGLAAVGRRRRNA